MNSGAATFLMEERKTNKNLVVISGPTGVGKTDLSIRLAHYFNAEIISSDSRQFYRELSIGTAIPSREQLQQIPHHFIHIRSVTEYYNASMFESDAIDKLDLLFRTDDFALMVGGSGMYIDAVCNGIDDIPDADMELRKMLTERIRVEGLETIRAELRILDPVFYASADIRNAQRILRAMEVCLQTGKPFSSFRLKTPKKRSFNIIKIGLNRDRDELYSRINRRVKQMINTGLVDEAEKVCRHKGVYALKTVGYKELFDYFDGIGSLEKAEELIKQNTRNYARRQMTWFRRDKEIKWFHPDQEEEIIRYIEGRD